MKFITEKDVENNLRMKELMDILEDAFVEYGEGRADASPRDRLFTGSAFLNTMPAYIDKYGIAGLKTYVAGVNGTKFVVMFSLTLILLSTSMVLVASSSIAVQNGHATATVLAPVSSACFILILLIDSSFSTLYQ